MKISQICLISQNTGKLKEYRSFLEQSIANLPIDCEEIQSIAIQFGAEAPFLRPDNLATDTATALAADQHALKWIEHDEHVEYDFFVELLVTNPMKSSEDIDGAIEKLINTGADSVIGVTKLDDHHPIRVKKIEDDLITDFCLPEIPETHRQQLTPEAYIRNGAIYASRRDLILAGKRYGTTNSRPYIMQADRSVNIDGEIDFLMAEILISKYHGDRIFNKN